MDLELWLLFIVAVLVLSFTPGPNGLLAITHGALFGARRASFTVLGGVFGFLVLMAASMAGLGAVLAASEQAFRVLKWGGAAYLVYLGIRTWRAPPVSREALQVETPVGRPRAMFLNGFLVAVSNPKGILFFAALLPQFMDTGRGQLEQFATMALTFAVLECSVELMFAHLAQRIAPWLARSGRMFNRISGATFVIAGTVLAAADR
jgi:threonine/homoserine/homoserine lactone efflux protein